MPTGGRSDAPLHDTSLAVLFAVWLSISGFLALGLVRAAEHDAPLPALAA